MEEPRRFEETQLGQLSYKLQAFIATQLPAEQRLRSSNLNRHKELHKRDSHFFIADVAPQYNPDTGKTNLNVDMPSIIESQVAPVDSPVEDDVFTIEPQLLETLTESTSEQASGLVAPQANSLMINSPNVNMKEKNSIPKTKRPPPATVLTRTGQAGFGHIR